MFRRARVETTPLARLAAKLGSRVVIEVPFMKRVGEQAWKGER